MFVNGSHEDVKCVFEEVMFPAKTVLKGLSPHVAGRAGRTGDFCGSTMDLWLEEKGKGQGK